MDHTFAGTTVFRTGWRRLLPPVPHREVPDIKEDTGSLKPAETASHWGILFVVTSCFGSTGVCNVPLRAFESRREDGRLNRHGNLSDIQCIKAIISLIRKDKDFVCSRAFCQAELQPEKTH